MRVRDGESLHMNAAPWKKKESVYVNTTLRVAVRVCMRMQHRVKECVYEYSTEDGGESLHVNAAPFEKRPVWEYNVDELPCVREKWRKSSQRLNKTTTGHTGDKWKKVKIGW